MIEKINKVIDEWDPLGLFPFAPKDEYIDESILIYEAYQKSKDIHTLAKAIYEIFSKRFGDDIFTATIDECIKIASIIANFDKIA